MTKEAFLNALTVDMALGCSTNTMLHIPAIAHEAGFDFDTELANEISERHRTCAIWHRPVRPTWRTSMRLAAYMR